MSIYIEQVTARLRPVSVTSAFLRGMTGFSAHWGRHPLLASDITHGLVPGLHWCGIQAELVALPDIALQGVSLLRRQFRRSQGVLLLAFSASIDFGARPDPETPNPLVVWMPDPVVTRQGLVTTMIPTHDTISISESHSEDASSRLSYDELKNHFSHLLLLRKSTPRGLKAAHRDAALRTWGLFARAYPTRFLSSPDSDDNHTADNRLAEGAIKKERVAEEEARRSLAVAFWRELAGSERSAASNTLRRLAASLETARTPSAFQAIADTLATLTCRQFQLPAFVENALLAPPSAVLTDAERRELIYLARAGTRDVKVFAAYRLGFERESADARSTLQQLRFDADAWVRAAARL